MWASYQILTGTKPEGYSQRFPGGQEESVQYYCCQNYQGTECVTYALNHFYIDLKSFASQSLICFSSGWI